MCSFYSLVGVYFLSVSENVNRKSFRHSWSLNKHDCEQKTAITMHGTLSCLSHTVQYPILSHVVNYAILPVSHYSIPYPTCLTLDGIVSYLSHIAK